MPMGQFSPNIPNHIKFTIKCQITTSNRSLCSHRKVNYKRSQNEKCRTIQTGTQYIIYIHTKETKYTYEQHQQTTTTEKAPDLGQLQNNVEGINRRIDDCLSHG